MRRFRYSTSNEKVTNSANIKETEPINPERNIIICLDGTGGEFGEKPHTNVLDLFKLLEKDSPNQYCYYQPGIGVKFVTDAHEFLDSGFFESKYHKMLNRADAMVAFTLRKHIIAAYTYLCDNYRLGDKVYLFGFR